MLITNVDNMTYYLHIAYMMFCGNILLFWFYKQHLNDFVQIVGFAASELCTRIEHAEPKVVIAANCGVEPNKVIRFVFGSCYTLKC